MAKSRWERRKLRAILYGRLRDAMTGEPVAGATVSVGLRLGQAGELVLASGRSDAEGLYHLRSFAGYSGAAAYDVGCAAPSAYRRTAGDGRWCQIFSAVLGDAAVNQTIWLAPVARLGGRVLDSSGNGVESATVEVSHAATAAILAALPSGPHGIYTLRDHGDLFALGHFTPGAAPALTVHLRVKKSAAEPFGAPVAATVAPGTVTTVNLNV